MCKLRGAGGYRTSRDARASRSLAVEILRLSQRSWLPDPAGIGSGGLLAGSKQVFDPKGGLSRTFLTYRVNTFSEPKNVFLL